MVGQWLVNGRAMVGQWLANGWPVFGQWLANGRPRVGQCLANGWPRVGVWLLLGLYSYNQVQTMSQVQTMKTINIQINRGAILLPRFMERSCTMLEETESFCLSDRLKCFPTCVTTIHDEFSLLQILTTHMGGNFCCHCQGMCCVQPKWCWQFVPPIDSNTIFMIMHSSPDGFFQPSGLRGYNRQITRNSIAVRFVRDVGKLQYPFRGVFNHVEMPGLLYEVITLITFFKFVRKGPCPG